MTSSVLHRNTQLGKLSYDGNLNVLGYDGWTFGHDAEKRLLSVMGHGHSALFAYDGLGRCVKRIIDGATTVFTYDGWKPVAEWTSGGNFVAWNLYGVGADEILVRYQQNPAGYLHYHLDAMGNVQFLLSDQPNPGLEKYTYDVFGKPTITGWNGDGRPVSNHGNRFLFTGREYLYSFGMYDYRHRIYHPGLGRFIETDPLGLQIEGAKLSAEEKALYLGVASPETFSSSELNLYRYCHNDPINRSDPFGTISEVMVEGNEITIRVPMHFTGEGMTAKLVARYIEGIQKKFTGTFGPYKVTTTVDTEHGLRKGNRFNEIKVVKDPNYRSNIVGSRNGTWNNSGSRDMAGHEGGHDLGLPDRYTDVKQKDGTKRSIPNPGYEQNVMGNMSASPSAQDIRDVIGNKRVNDIIRVLPAQKP